MKALLTLAASAFCFAALAVPAQAQCYRKVGKVCKGGYATGLSAGCALRCRMPAKAGAPKVAPMSAPMSAPAAAPEKPKPHAIISPVS